MKAYALAFRLSSEFGKIFVMNLKVQTGFKFKSTPYIFPIIEKLINWKSKEKKTKLNVILHSLHVSLINEGGRYAHM